MDKMLAADIERIRPGTAGHIKALPALAERFQVRWAREKREVREAQRLRYRVFVGELGARPAPFIGAPPGHDADRFDAYCEHLLVRAGGAGRAPGEVIGTYRVLTPAAAALAGGLYSETEFDLGRLRQRLASAVELGRSCVHPDWRSGGVVMALWAALGEFMLANGLDTMIGCASVSMRDGGHSAASLWSRLRQTHLAAPEWLVTPRLALPVDQLRQDLPAETPALIKGYLRCGAKLLGPPAWDPDFQTADLPLMMRLPDLPDRYRRHFLGT
jgi:putative hemolysin